MAESSSQFTVASRPERLTKIREKVGRAAQKAGLAEDLSANIILAVDEACSNIIRHGYDCDPDQQLEVTILWTPDTFEVRIKDTGMSFDPCKAEPRDPAQIRPGGLGIYIIRQVMDRVSYVTQASGCNVTTLVKKL